MKGRGGRKRREEGAWEENESQKAWFPGQLLLGTSLPP